MDIFEILGPVMVGPSSSHTAGAVRIGKVARSLLGEDVAEADICLHGSFAKTGKGHGTDRALLAGLMGLKPDDPRIPTAFSLAEERGLRYGFRREDLGEVHPNTVRMTLRGREGASLSVEACSVGGGRIRVRQVNGLRVDFGGEHPTLVVSHRDQPGLIANTTRGLAERGINIAAMQVFRDSRGGLAIMVIEVDQKVPREVRQQLRTLEGIVSVTYLEEQ